MRIRDIEITPFAGSDLMHLTINAENGLKGSSWVCGASPEIVTALANEILIGRDPRAISSIWDDGGKAAQTFAPAEAGRARAALDIACWDIKARKNGEPLWKTLGGTHFGAIAFASVRFPALPDGKAMDQFAALVAGGAFRQGLLKLGSDSEFDNQIVARMSDTLSEQAFPIDMMLDFGGVTPVEAIRRIDGLEQSFDITWVKGVSETGDPLDCAQVSNSISAAVCLGGELASETQFLPLLKQQVVNVIEIDLQLLGITGTLRVADAAWGYEIPVTLKSAPGNLPVQIASALPNFMGMEVIDARLSADGASSSAGFVDGRVLASEQPGSGIEAAPLVPA